MFEIAQAHTKLWNVKGMPAVAERVRSRAKYDAAQICLSNHLSSMVDVVGEDGEQCFHVCPERLPIGMEEQCHDAP